MLRVEASKALFNFRKRFIATSLMNGCLVHYISTLLSLEIYLKHI